MCVCAGSVVLDNRNADVWDVVGVMRGQEEPDRYVILGGWGTAPAWP